ncbi:MAG: hypothetical protein U5N85_09970 [Arcicella sp.]|nr:hypothetical protein [Arcicella sp.]
MYLRVPPRLADETSIMASGKNNLAASSMALSLSLLSSDLSVNDAQIIPKLFHFGNSLIAVFLSFFFGYGRLRTLLLYTECGEGCVCAGACGAGTDAGGGNVGMAA